MMDINEFSARYQISPSWARRLVRAGEIKAEKTNGRYLIASEEAERWMTENPYRIWVRNISRPELPAVAANTCDMLTLIFCSKSYNIQHVEAHGNMRWRVQRLLKHGITIERGWRRGTYPYYRLKDVVEIELPEESWRLEPHPDYQD
ncbi:helix-turn-helix domain-containing protein [Microvirga sp. Mcv34]|uniref:helix-turn-helix domain-containing protein n=1 Tax=Microvirga sp. Mcv34 TaxID=2926016 RepID=UPI0021C9D43E|nr:helix-turn-helix domain-containing protein [Microvirga sp. Mcv34]